MEQRHSLRNLAITIAIIVCVAVAAEVLRDRNPHTIPIRREPAATESGTVAPALPGGPAQRSVEKHFLTFPNAQLVASPSNEADTLRVRLPKEGEQVFVHYFIDALDTSFAHLDRVNEQAHYFGRASNDSVVVAGKEAMSYVADMLKNHPFMILTRWERVPATDRYYALIRVEYEKGKWRYLSDLLVRQGYARVAGVTTPLPDSKLTEDDYLQELTSDAKYARQKKLGIWAKVKSK